MKTPAILTALALLCTGPAVAEETVTVPFGTVVIVTIDEALSTHAKAKKAATKGYRSVKAGDLIVARATDDVKIDGQTVIKAGAPVTFRVSSQTKKNRRMGRKGLLVLEAVMAQAVDGSAVPVQGQVDSEGSGRIGTTVGLTYALGPLGLLKRGKPAELPAGGVYQVMVGGGVEITVE